MKERLLSEIRRGTAVVLLLLPLCPASYGNGQPDNEPAGKITGLHAAASKNGAAADIKDQVRTNQTLSTNRSGRVRVQLDDGSILSIGSETQVTVAKHESSSGETLIELGSGRLRSRVVKLRKSGSKFQVITPAARISVVGTDFYVDASPGKTQVVVYSGIVLVGANSGGSPVDVAAGQMATVDNKGISRLVLTPEDYEQETIASTALPEEIVPVKTATDTSETPKSRSHLRRNILIGAVVAGGALAGGLAARHGGNSSATSTPSQPTIPTIPPR